MDGTPPTSTDQTAERKPLHPILIAAHEGFGPMSGQAQMEWHGDSAPCASCAHLNHRDAESCQHCGQSLSQDMLQKMANHSGPWFVFDPIHPFPGVALERIERQIERKVITRTTIIRGPTTYYQWRYATETPLVARLLGRCWSCQEKVDANREKCPDCSAKLDGYFRPGQLGQQQSEEDRLIGQLEMASSIPSDLDLAIRSIGPAPTPAQIAQRGERPLGKPLLIFVVISLIFLATLIMIATASDSGTTPAQVTGVQPTSTS